MSAHEARGAGPVDRVALRHRLRTDTVYPHLRVPVHVIVVLTVLPISAATNSHNKSFCYCYRCYDCRYYYY